jgi:3-oxoacyl-[acyl-carrier protein] reductase
MKKVAIVTGASRGIGRAVAKRLAIDGFGVVVNYLNNRAEAEQVVAELKGIGGNAIAIQGDVANPADVERLFNETVKQFGSVNVVVHNSGIMPLSPIDKAEVDLFDKVISTNLRGAFLVLATQFTRISVSHTSRERAFVNAITPALAAEYVARFGRPSLPARDPILTIRPRPARRMSGRTVRVTSNTPMRLTSTIFCHSPASSSWKGL